MLLRHQLGRVLGSESSNFELSGVVQVPVGFEISNLGLCWVSNILQPGFRLSNFSVSQVPSRLADLNSNKFVESGRILYL